MSHAAAGLDELRGQHAVTFYRSDSELFGLLEPYVLSALLDGGGCVVIVTAPHAAELRTRLSRSGIELEGYRASGALTILDAQLTLERFVHSGQLDPVAFDAVVGERVRAASRPGRRIAAFGEMVGLLWADGLVSAALELEDLWAELRDRFPFDLLCGYPADPPVAPASPASDADPLEQVRRRHWPVLTGSTTAATLLEGAIGAASREFTSTVESPGAARRFAATMLAEWGADDVIEDAELVVTELATNAVSHARSSFRVQLTCSARSLRVSVTDASRDAPRTGPAMPRATSGRGLLLVAAVARSWGSEPTGHGKLVWAELRR